MLGVDRRFLLVHGIAVLALPAAGAIASVLLLATGRLHWSDVVGLAALYALTGIGVEVGFHRGFSHRAFRPSPALTSVLVVLGSFAAQGPALYWAAVHRHHHRHADSPADPHSPVTHGGWRGFVHAHAGWMFNPPPDEAFSTIDDLVSDRRLVRASRRYLAYLVLGLALPAAFSFVVTRSAEGALRGFLVGGLFRTFLTLHVVYAVNSVCHLLGQRPFASDDNSRDVGWLALPTFGGAWHNTHHAFPFTANNGLLPGRIDPGYLVIRAFQALGWASKIRHPTAKGIAKKTRAGSR